MGIGPLNQAKAVVALCRVLCLGLRCEIMEFKSPNVFVEFYIYDKFGRV